MVNFINRRTVDIPVIIAHLKMEKCTVCSNVPSKLKYSLQVFFFYFFIFSFYFSLFSPHRSNYVHKNYIKKLHRDSRSINKETIVYRGFYDKSEQ